MSCLFTIEQIELLRRLRKTGMTKEQLCLAYDEMDRVDNELNHLNNGSTRSQPSTPLDRHQRLSPIKEFQSPGSVVIESNQNQTSVEAIRFKSSLPPIQSFSPILAHRINRSDNNDHDHQFTPMMSQQVTSPLTVSSSMTITPVQTQPENSTPQTQQFYLNNNKLAVGNETLELNEFKKKGEAAILDEIKSFIVKYNIRQVMISEMTKISQPYISRFFRGEDMPERAKNLMYIWYLSVRNRPEIMTQCCPQTIGERRTMITDVGDFLPIRRDRFIFRKEHLTILDKHFKENAYPDASAKELIAEECNKEVERLTNKVLKERDKVTVTTVSNWFNNKRKEMKQKKQLLRGQQLNQPLLTETSPFSAQNLNLQSQNSNDEMSGFSDYQNGPSSDSNQEEMIMTDEDDDSQSFSAANFSQEKPELMCIKLEPDTILGSQ